MTKNIKTMFIITLLIIATLSFIPEAKAVTISSNNTCYYFHKTTGNYSGLKISSSYGRDCVKELTGDTNVDGKKAYCVEWGKSIKTKTYQKRTDWNPKTQTAILAGLIIDNINEDYSGTKAYAITAAALNTYFSKKSNLNYAASKNFYSSNDTIKKYYDEVHSEYKDKGYTTETTITKPTISGTRLLDYSSSRGYYISKKITTTLTKTYGGDAVTYTISANKNAQICDTNTGKNCSTTKTVTNKDSYSFYVKVLTSAVTAGNTVKITVSGSNSSTYPSTLQYIGTNYTNSTQRLVVPTTVSIDRTTTQSYYLTVPDLTQHMIKVLKVDEYGNKLNGASLSLYRGDPETGTLLKSNTNGNGDFTYRAPKTTTDDDNFFNYDYYLVEKSSPDGYVLNKNNNITQIYKKGTAINNSTEKCYNTEGDEFQEVDSERCNFENYDYVCIDSTGAVTDKVTVENNCEVIIEEPTPDTPNPGEEEGEPTTQEEIGTTEGDGDTTTEGSGGNTGTEGDGEGETTEPEQPAETYTKVCYNNFEKKEADSTYCTDKENYTKIQSSNGNITITKTNVLNKVYISKRDITGEEEIAGATLKICTKENYDKDKEECKAATTIKDVEMSWTSTSSAKLIQGVPSGTYVIIEVLPPSGYIKSTTVTEFTVDASGKVVSNNTEVTEESPIVIKNEINSLSISKQDITTAKELPGATLSICLTYLNEETKKITLEIDEVSGDCIPAVLANGKKATWTSTDKPHLIEGLAAGTYYLVENIAPKGYATAESILFTVNHDGRITDVNNKPIENNKIVMKDELINQVPTGDLPIIGIITIGLAGLVTGAICYRYSNKKYGLI